MEPNEKTNNSQHKANGAVYNDTQERQSRGMPETRRISIVEIYRSIRYIRYGSVPFSQCIAFYVSKFSKF
jgi:hypothetical protein